MVTENRQTLLAKIVPMFASTENVAVEALAHILSESKATRHALWDILRSGGAMVGQLARVRTQATGKDNERPDLVGFDERDQECVLIEAKFWAGLTDNQPLAYLERLPERDPSALLFVAPAARIESLWTELSRQISESALGITAESFKETQTIRSAAVGGGRWLMLTSWKNLLDRMAAEAAADTDSHAETDIRQLRGLAVREDAEAFLPLRREELGQEFPRRMLRLRELVDDATERGIQAGWADTKGLRVTPKEWGYGRYLRLGGEQTWFGIDFISWASNSRTPLWLWFSPTNTERIRRIVESPRQLHPCEVVQWDDGLAVPIELPVSVEYEAVRDAVVARLGEIAQMFSDASR